MANPSNGSTPRSVSETATLNSPNQRTNSAPPVPDAAVKTDTGLTVPSDPLGQFSQIFSEKTRIFRAPRPVEANEYFVGPRSFDRHSKWPMFMRLHGSILPKMIVPLLFIGGWASAITCIHQLYHDIGLSNVLLTVLGFVVGLSLSFRNTTAYERYAEGRKYWQMLTQTSDTLARTVWIHVREREEKEYRSQDLLNKLSFLNLIAAYSRALMHKLRFEPYMDHDDLHGLVSHLDTLSRDATKVNAKPTEEKIAYEKRFTTKVRNWADTYIGEYLGLQFASENPRKALKEAEVPVGNLPLEILSYLSTYIDFVIKEEMLPVSSFQVHAANTLLGLQEILSGCERILNTPLPLAYCIAITQITWLYILVLPFQLVEPLRWLAIPGTLVAGYIIIGLLVIGQEIENPFGNDVNDLPLEQFCALIAQNVKIIASQKIERDPSSFMNSAKNKLWHLYFGAESADEKVDPNAPNSETDANLFYPAWANQDPSHIRTVIRDAVRTAEEDKDGSAAASIMPTPLRSNTQALPQQSRPSQESEMRRRATQDHTSPH